MKIQARLLIIILVNGLFLFLDRLLKYASTHVWGQQYLINKFLGWQPSFNSGVAFSLPMPNQVIIILTIPILLIIGYLFIQQIQSTHLNMAFSLIIMGALSNLYDRLIYHHTVDYFILFTAIINIADVMITVGFLIYLFGRKIRTH